MSANMRPFRFFDNREKYLLFVTSCAEKPAIAARVGEEIDALRPRPPAIRLFDAGTGDGTVLSSVLKDLHARHPTVPVVAIGKEISVEDVRMTLARLPDRFAEHPNLVVVMTNLRFREAPALAADGGRTAEWRTVGLPGSTAHEFDREIRALTPWLGRAWRVRESPRTGNPLYETPRVLVLVREDRRFVLGDVVPAPGRPPAGYDLVLAAQPFRTRQPVDAKVSTVLAPLARALVPGGRLVGIQSTGHDPGMEIVRGVWPGEDPFLTPGPMLTAALLERLRAEGCDDFAALAPRHSLFRYHLHVPGGHAPPARASSATLLAAWNAATYVAQIDDERIARAMDTNDYLDVTARVLERHGGLWFVDEAFVLDRRSGVS